MLVITTNLINPESTPALANFYSLKVKLNSVVICSLVSKNTLLGQCEVFKTLKTKFLKTN